jgi:hypothetical protein
MNKSGMIRISDGIAQQIRNGHSVRVALCIHPTRIKDKKRERWKQSKGSRDKVSM